MLSKDQMARNLFGRVFDYIPSEGEFRKREPLEDFCTESIAYLLTASPEIRGAFIREILGVQDAAADQYEVETQFSLSRAEDMEDTPSTVRSRIDLMLLPTAAGAPVIAVESKLNASPGENQLTAMTKRVADYATKRGNHARSGCYYLVPQHHPRSHRNAAESLGFKVVHWESVQGLLSRLASQLPDSQRVIALEFAEFLAAHGLTTLTMTTQPTKASNLADFTRLMGEWSEFLNKLMHDDPDFRPVMKAAPVWSNDTPAYYGVYGREDKYVGFEIDSSAGTVRCYCEDVVKGKAALAWKDRVKDTVLTKFQDDWKKDGTLWISATRDYPDSVKTEALFDAFRGLRADLKAAKAGAGRAKGVLTVRSGQFSG